MYAQGNRLGDSQRSIPAALVSVALYDEHARLALEQPPNRVGAEAPELAQLLRGIMALRHYARERRHRI
jgi:hypothetical protein